MMREWQRSSTSGWGKPDRPACLPPLSDVSLLLRMTLSNMSTLCLIAPSRRPDSSLGVGLCKDVEI